MNDLVKTFLAGGFAGSMVDLVLFPLDSLKTRIQMRKPLTGPFSELYKGIWWSLASSFPCAAVFWVSFTVFSKLLLEFWQESLLVDVLAATFGSFCCCLIRCPFELLKTQTICGKFKHFWEAPAQIVQKEGIPGLYVGFTALVCRELPFDSIQMMFFSIFSEIWMLNWTLGPFSVSGALAGALTGLITTPIDVVKTKIMMDNEKFRSVKTSAKAIYEAEGLSGLWKGWKHRMLFVTIGGWIFFGSFNLTMELLG